MEGWRRQNIQDAVTCPAPRAGEWKGIGQAIALSLLGSAPPSHNNSYRTSALKIRTAHLHSFLPTSDTLHPLLFFFSCFSWNLQVSSALKTQNPNQK